MSQTTPQARHRGKHGSIVLALILGLAVGCGLQWLIYQAGGEKPGWVVMLLDAFRFFADLFLRVLKMIIVPLVVGSIISGIAGMSSLEGFARMGLKTWAYYLIGSLVAVAVGLAMVNLVQPGMSGGVPNPTLRAAMDAALVSDQASQVGEVMERAEGGAGSLLDIVKRMIPTNVVEACAKGDLLAIIFFSILFAVAMALLPGGPPPVLRDGFNELVAVMTLITHWIMKFTPIAVFCLLVPAVAEVGVGVLQNLLPYLLTVVGALGIYTFVILPLALKLLGRRSPLQHIREMKDSLLMAFSTASSSATIPVTMRCLRENAGVSERVTSFVIPLGATVNMDGTALYECVVVVFAAQVFGLELSFSQQWVVVLLALVSSIGVAGIPAASLVAIIIIMENAGFSDSMVKASLALVLTLDRPLDMARTAVNVFGDTVGTVVIAKSEGETLSE
ncbi:MAG: dicarboxylate/amino acid:cation symporter [Akkermansiaceae bacterium]|nr:dicarboxylate/amino acid:cation symporter [Akkermansiaceae bacterium]